ncbi:MAG: N-acetylmuramoyl-L-alanine amidase, partial [Acidimicrobiia bacterium]
LPFVCGGGPVSAAELKFAVVHHTAGSNSYGPGDSVAIIRGIYAYHVNTLGYCDVAYNFFVDKYGQIFEGRRGGVDQPIIGGHSGGFNTSSTGIAVLGNYQTSNVPAAGWDAVVRLLRWKLSVHRVDPALGFSTVVASSPCNCMHWPAGTLVSFPNAIVGHRELDATLCPGGSFFAQFGALRSQVQSGISIPPPPTSTTATTVL